MLIEPPEVNNGSRCEPATTSSFTHVPATESCAPELSSTAGAGKPLVVISNSGVFDATRVILPAGAAMLPLSSIRPASRSTEPPAPTFKVVSAGRVICPSAETVSWVMPPTPNRSGLIRVTSCDGNGS